MQMKSYRLLKWTLLGCVTASLATACVVTTGDGSGDDFFDGGEGGTSSNAGTNATGGAGTSSTAGTGGSTAGSTATGGGGSGTSGSGGSVAAYVPGLCDADATGGEGPTPTDLPSAALNADDNKPENECRKCLKQQCPSDWQTCYGSKPTIACGYGDTAEAAGQFDCFLDCFQTGAMNPMGTADELVSECSGECTNQCDDGGNLMVHTSDLITCANDPDKCQAACLPF